MRVALLGGSFDPPHAGHLAISRHALSALNLHAVIWLVSPQNPLKKHPPAPQNERLIACRALIDHPRIFASPIERVWQSATSIDTVTRFRKHYPATQFVWLIGSDNFATFHHWHRWKDIMQTLPLAIYPRHGSHLHAPLGPAAQYFSRQRTTPSALMQKKAPAWALLSGPDYRLSSRHIRTKQNNGLNTG